LEELFRNVHSLKGAARAVSLQPIEELAHGMEDVFGAAKRGTARLTPTLFDLLYQGHDLIGKVMAGVDSGQGIDPAMDLSGYLVQLAAAWRGQPIEPPLIEEVQVREAPEPRREPVLPWVSETIRVSTTRLDELMAQSGELLVARLRAVRQAEQADELYASMVHWRREWQRMRGSLKMAAGGNGKGTADWAGFLERNEAYLQELSARLGAFSRRLREAAGQLTMVAEELQEGVKRTRMLPLATLLPALRRVVRDLAREKGVEVALDVEGAETEMDKHVLEQLQDPLMHMLRNAIDHGIEPPERREELGKPRTGRIELRATRQGSAILVEVKDNGRGVDVEAVREAAVKRGILSAEVVAEMARQEALELIFAPDLSTSPIITEVSGRGVGLDVVRKNVEGLQGQVEVWTESDAGTTFRLTLPLTLVSTRCLLLRAQDQVYAVSLGAVERLVGVEREEVGLTEGRQAIIFDGRPLPLARLADLLRMTGGGAWGEGEQRPAVILAAGGQRVAFLVDELLGEEEVVVKGLGPQLRRVPNVAGATVLGTGDVVLILNVADLIKSAQMSTAGELLEREAPVEEKRRPVILVVDDSITTRTLEKNILTTAGYEVRLATDGEEGLARLMEGGCDLIVADVDMPRMDGFELTSRVRGDERYQDMPVILVTSLDTPAHKARGIEVGADAYIVKGTFDQDNLLQTIRQLI
jgi:two-component system chemotaxis sensor kinase CheA